MKKILVKSIVAVSAAIVLLGIVSKLAISAEGDEIIPNDYQPTYRQRMLVPEGGSNTGAAVYRVPIEVPPARGEVTRPELDSGFRRNDAAAELALMGKCPALSW